MRGERPKGLSLYLLWTGRQYHSVISWKASRRLHELSSAHTPGMTAEMSLPKTWSLVSVWCDEKKDPCWGFCHSRGLAFKVILRSRAAFSLGLIIPSGYSPWGCKRVRHDLATKQLFPIVSASHFCASHSTQCPMSHEVFQSGWWEQLGIAPFNLFRWFLQLSGVMSHTSSLCYSVLWILAVLVFPYS